MPALKQKIISEIKQSGGIGVDRYMELCNAHYYATRDPFGVAGDFITAPEISQIFGEMIGVWAITQWEKLGKPNKCALVEFGPGRGTLMADLLRAIKVAPEFKPEIHLVEFSPVLKKAQQEKLPSYKVEWHEELPKLDIPIIIIANEFFDALPVKQFVKGVERKVIFENNELHFNLPAEDGLVEERCEVGQKIMADISKTVAAGIIIDYGYTHSAHNNTLQAVKSHKYHNVLSDSGEADITTLVDFDALTKSSKKTCTIITQREFLLAHGADVRAKMLDKESDLIRLVDPKQMGELFKVLCF